MHAKCVHSPPRGAEVQEHRLSIGGNMIALAALMAVRAIELPWDAPIPTSDLERILPNNFADLTTVGQDLGDAGLALNLGCNLQSEYGSGSGEYGSYDLDR